MLRITLSADEEYDEEKNEFLVVKPQVLYLEHSLVSLSKWEANWHKPFLSRENKTYEEMVDYIRCMTVTKDVDAGVYRRITSDHLEAVDKYIIESMTATTFSKENRPKSRDVVTAEIIYYWMVSLNIPFECQKWHLNRLLTLIKVCNIKSAPAKKMGKRDILKQNAAINAARRKSLGTKG